MLERTTEHRLEKNKNPRAVELPGTHRVLTAPVGGTRDMSQSEHLEQLDITEQQAGHGPWSLQPALALNWINLLG